MSNYEEFGSDYFSDRNMTDLQRLKQFDLEKDYCKKFIGESVFQSGMILDVGCSTGEFLESIKWNHDGRYGIEISQYAKEIAQARGVKFTKSLDDSDFFDLIVFRGTIQYLLSPFEDIKNSYKALKKNGYILFLATPNTNSIYYQKFKTLPFLEESLNYYLPSDTSLSMNLRNAGFEIIDIHFPYLDTPYTNFLSDHLKFLRKYFFGGHHRFPFWKSMMWVIAKKPENP